MRSGTKKLLKRGLSVFLMAAFILLLTEGVIRFIQIAWPPVYRACFDQQGTQYIYMLGESTAEGVQYQDKISPAILVSHAFNDTLQGNKTQVIQLGSSGKTIEYTYFKFYFETLFKPHKNALVLIYNGINEGIGRHHAPTSFLWRAVQHSIVLSKLAYAFESDLYGNSPEKYAYRYHQTIHTAKRLGYHMVVSQLVGNFLEFDPRVYPEDVLLQPDKYSALQRAETAIDNNCYALANSICDSLAVGLEEEHPYLTYLKARCNYGEEHYDSARMLLLHVTDIDNSVGFQAWKNRVLERVCAEEKVPLARTFDRFCDSAEHGIIGYNLINDAHHPNLKGYCIMGNEMARCVSELYQQKARRTLSPENVSADFQFDNQLYTGVYYRLCEWFVWELCNTHEKMRRYNRLVFYLQKYESLRPEDESLILWRLIAAIEIKNETAFWANLHALYQAKSKADLLNRFNNSFGDRGQIEKEIREFIAPWKPHNADEQHMKDDFFKAV